MVARVTRFEGRTPDAAGQQPVHTATFSQRSRASRVEGSSCSDDPEQGVGLAVSLWTTEEAAQASEDAAHFLREATTNVGESVASIERFEVTLFHV